MQLDLDAPTNDLIAMNITMSAIDQWLKNISSDRNGEELGREIAALYREIHAAVDEMSPSSEDFDDDEDFDEDEEDDEGESDERD